MGRAAGKCMDRLTDPGREMVQDAGVENIREREQQGHGERGREVGGDKESLGEKHMEG